VSGSSYVLSVAHAPFVAEFERSQTRWKSEGHRDKHDKLRFEVTVTLPQTSDDSPLAINKLSTDLHIFSQIFGDLSNVAFKTLSVHGSLSAVHAEVRLTPPLSNNTLN
jgi:hypothetical protein